MLLEFVAELLEAVKAMLAQEREEPINDCSRAELTFPRPNPEVAGLPNVEVDPNEAVGPPMLKLI